MLYRSVNVNALSSVLPDEIITSDELEARLAPLYERLRLPRGRLELMSGIRERRLWPAGMKPSAAAAAAGRTAMAQAGIHPDDVDCLLNCSVSRDFVEPATSSVVHRLLELPETAVNFDISNACLGVLSGMMVLANMITLGQARTGLVVAAENSRPLLEATIEQLNADRSLTRRTVKNSFASLTIGSAAAAVAMSHVDSALPGHRLLGGVHHCRTLHNTLCTGSADTGMDGSAQPLMDTDSGELLVRGLEVAADAWIRMKDTLNWTEETPDVICTHQVGRVHRQMLYETLNVDAAKDFSTVEHLGNCGAASVPVTASRAVEQGRLVPGNVLALFGIGSGINCMMLGVQW